jgi:putative tricarboxylic transport membrane protein
LLGLSFIVSLAGHNLVKGFMMAAFGFLLAMVGLDPQSSIQRFTFGHLYLWDGVNVVPVVVGLFGGAEVLQLMMTTGSIARTGESRPIAGVMQGVRDTFAHMGLTLRASAIGVAIGVIPGMGGAVSQFIAYAHAQQTSKHPETFGKGNVEGVLAAGAVNNSREGGNLIPTVAFGIPGSISMAILLSVFLLKGLVPGPAMLTKNLNVTYSMVWVIVLSNIIAVSVSFLFLNQLVRLTRVKGTRLIPFLLVLLAFGAYSAHNSFADILLMLGATAVGIAAVLWDWPRAPLLLALVLGDIAERYLFLSYSLYEWTWLKRPLVMAFAAVTIAGLAWPFVRMRINERRRSQARTPGSAEDTILMPLRLLSMDLVITIAFLIVASAVLLQARAWPFRTSLFPLAAGSVLFGMALLKVALAFAPARRRVASKPLGLVEEANVEEAESIDVFATASHAQWVSALGWLSAFFAMLWLLGALITVPLFAMLYLLAASRESPVLAGSYALASWLFVYGLFDRVLHTPLPAGALLNIF